jgi:hypothetical protein
VGERE